MPHDRIYSWSDAAISRSPVSIGYRIGLLVVTVTTVMLPLVYILFCAAIAYGIFLYATNDYFLLGYHQPGIVAYLGPIIAGCIGLVFMVKPLFTSQPKINAHIIITRDSQPELFQFIEEVCRRVGAPRPVRVLLDNQVNASASFEHGLWGALTNRLVLTIGAPLAQGLTVSQFGGVRAHEFGHFTQAVAMRFNFLIRSTNGWFSRVIYERDEFDAKLAAWSRRGNIYWIIMANIAVCFVWFARKVLWLLMRAGHAISAYMMRQMEYDADHYEMEVAGTANFKETFLRMQLLNVGIQMSRNHLNQLWKDGKLVDNLPLLTHRLTSTLSDQTVQSLHANFEADQSRAKWYSTHPSDFERISRSVRAPQAGVLQGDSPSATLFADFEKMAQVLTQIEYRQRLKLDFKNEALISTETYVSENSARSEKLRSIGQFFGGVLQEHNLVYPPPMPIESTLPLEEINTQFNESARALEDQRSTTDAARGRMETARGKRGQAFAAETLLNMGIRIAPSAFGLKDTNRTTIQAAVDANSTAIVQEETALATPLRLAHEKLRYFCGLAECQEWCARGQDSTKWQEWMNRIAELKKVLSQLKPIAEILNQDRKSMFLATIYVENFQAAKDKKYAEREFETLTNGFRDTIKRIEDLATQITYPLRDGKSSGHVTGYFLLGNNQPGPMGRYLHLRSIYERFLHLYMETMMELLEKLSAVKKAAIVPAEAAVDG